MLGSGNSGRRKLAGGVICVLTVVGLVWTLTLVGCGSDATGARAVQLADDVCLFAGSLNPDKAGAPAGAPPAGDEKVTLEIDGSWHIDTVAVGAWERHRIDTKRGTIYIIELYHRTSLNDDPDLYISRNPDPYTNWWRCSTSFDPLGEVIVFKSNQVGTMYIGVRGYDSVDDSNVDYFIHVRTAKVNLNTG